MTRRTLTRGTLTRLRRTRGTTVTAMALVLVVGLLTGNAIGSGDQNGDMYTGCLMKNGRLYRVAIGETPTKDCTPDETEITWNQTGPAGPAGPPGADGAQGPAGPPGVLDFYVVETVVAAPDIPQPPGTSSPNKTVVLYAPGDIVANCDPGDAAVSADLTVETVSFSSSIGTTTVSLSVGGPVGRVLTSGMPTGYENLTGTSASASNWDVYGSGTIATQQRSLALVITCADLTP